MSNPIRPATFSGYGITAAEIRAGVVGDLDEKRDPQPVDIEDAMIFENFLANTRDAIIRKLEAAQADGDTKTIAAAKEQLNSLDGFFWLVAVPAMRSASEAFARSVDPVAMLEALLKKMIAS